MTRVHSFSNHSVVHLSSVHPPLDTRIFYKECQTLIQAGYQVTLMIPHQYDEQIGEVYIHAIKQPHSRIDRMTQTVWCIWKAAWRKNASVYHFHDPELLPVGWLLSLQGKNVIYDVHEDVPKQILNKYWIPVWIRKWIARTVSGIETLVVRRLVGVVTATPAIARRFPAVKTVIVQNFPFLDELCREGESDTYQNRPNEIVYVGGITHNRGAYQMIEAVGRIPPVFHTRLVLAGKFMPAELSEDLRRLEAWKQVEFLDWVSRNQLREVLHRARLGLVLFHPLPNHIEAQPNKLFEYMSAGLPLVASDFPLWREIVADTGCGLLVDPLDTQAIADAIQWLLENPAEAEAMGRRGRKAVETRYNWELESQKLLHFYERLLS